MEWNEISHDPRHLGVLPGESKMISEPAVRSAQTCTYLASRLMLSPNEPKRDSTWPMSPRSSIGCVQNNIWAYGTFGAYRAPILHWHKHYLQMDRNEIQHDPGHLGVLSGESKTIFEPVVCSAQTCTYLVSWLTLSPNRPKQASTWSSRSTIWSVQNDFWAYGTFGTNHAPILHWH
jgi:hypothetical protein